MSKLDLVCIIDDDPVFIFGTKKLMELHGFADAFMIFQNGEEAHTFLEQLGGGDSLVPEVILLDLNMPGLDGWGFLDRYKDMKLNGKIKLFIVSSSIDPADIERANGYKCVSQYILKPLSAESLSHIASFVG